MRQTVLPVLVALSLVLAGCAAGPGTGPSGDTADDDGGTVNFYISDERNAIDQFEHLNVTVSSVGFHPAEGDDANETDDEEDVDTTDGVNATTTGVNDTTTATAADANETTAGQTETTVDSTTSANETDTDADETESEDAAETESEDAEETEADDEADEEERADWVQRDVENVTYDLTELQGANASLVTQFEVPAGEYDTAFIHVSEVNGTLKTGEQVNVKLPSEKLQVHTPFTVGPNSSVDFVFDVTVFEAGNSGMYILKPVVSESGTDVPIEATGDDRGERPEDAGERPDAAEDRDGDDADALALALDGAVTANETVTLSVTDNGTAVANASVTVNGEAAGQTDANGTLQVTVPADAEELEIAVEAGDREGELEREVTGADGEDGGPPEDAGGNGEQAAA